MSKHPTLTQLSEQTPEIQFFSEAFDSCEAADGITADAGAFRAGLYYVAADLAELARTGPPSKAEPIMAIVRLVQAVADN